MITVARENQSVVAVMSKDGDRVSGTAFFIQSDRLLTCHHLLDPEHLKGRKVTLRGRDGIRFEAQFIPWESVPSSDLAVLAVEWKKSRRFRGRGLPLAKAIDQTDAIRYVGYTADDSPEQDCGVENESNFPAQIVTAGRLGEHTSIILSLPNREYRMQGFALQDMAMTPRQSGGPIIDAETGAVVGFASAKNNLRTQGSGTSIPNDTLSGVGVAIGPLATAEGFRVLFDENQASRACYGRHLNEAGAKSILLEAFQWQINKLVKHDRYSRKRAHELPDLLEAVKAFLESGDEVLIVAGATRYRKTFSRAYLSEQRIEKREMTVFFAARHFVASERPFEAILYADSFDRPIDIRDVLAHLANGRQVLLIVDAINECGDMSRQQELLSPVRDLAEERGVKVIITCQSANVKEICKHFRNDKMRSFDLPAGLPHRNLNRRKLDSSV